MFLKKLTLVFLWSLYFLYHASNFKNILGIIFFVWASFHLVHTPTPHIQGWTCNTESFESHIGSQGAQTQAPWGSQKFQADATVIVRFNTGSPQIHSSKELKSLQTLFFFSLKKLWKSVKILEDFLLLQQLVHESSKSQEFCVKRVFCWEYTFLMFLSNLKN